MRMMPALRSDTEHSPQVRGTYTPRSRTTSRISVAPKRNEPHGTTSSHLWRPCAWRVKGASTKRAARSASFGSLKARMMPYDEWVRLRRPSQKEMDWANALYLEPDREIARLIAIFGPRVAE